MHSIQRIIEIADGPTRPFRAPILVLCVYAIFNQEEVEGPWIAYIRANMEHNDPDGEVLDELVTINHTTALSAIAELDILCADYLRKQGF